MMNLRIWNFIFVLLLSPTTCFASETVYAVAPLGLNVRAEPSNQAAVVAKMKFNEVCTLLGMSKKDEIECTAGNWVKVNYKGKTGYVWDAYLCAHSFPEHSDCCGHTMLDCLSKKYHFKIHSYKHEFDEESAWGEFYFFEQIVFKGERLTHVLALVQKLFGMSISTCELQSKKRIQVHDKKKRVKIEILMQGDKIALYISKSLT